MPAIQISTPLVTTKEMAKIIKVSPQTIDSWRKKKIIPHLSIRHVIRFNPERVLAALAKLEIKEAAGARS